MQNEKSKVLSQETRMEAGVLVVQRTVEERLTKMELEAEADNCKRQMQQCVYQSQQIKAQYDSWVNKLAVVNQLIAEFGADEMVIL